MICVLSQAVVQTATGLSSIEEARQRNVVHYIVYALYVLRPVFLDARVLLGAIITNFLANAGELKGSRENEPYTCFANNFLERIARTVYERQKFSVFPVLGMFW